MFELIQGAGDSFYIECPAKIGLVKLNNKDVCLIDSGSDKDAGRKVRQILDAKGWNLTAIYNTHSHADHIGGNQYLQKQTNCRIFAPGIECDFTCHPVLEPSFLYGGYPGKNLRHKFLMAKESLAERITEELLPAGWETIPLPGHSFDMTGFRTADDVVYLADCLSSRETLEKYKIGFIYDVAAYLDTLEKVKKMSAALFVPAHAKATEEIEALAQYNIDCVQEIGEHIVKCCSRPVCFEELLQKLFIDYHLNMTMEQYVLVGSTVRSYLTWLQENGRVQGNIENQHLLWNKVE